MVKPDLHTCTVHCIFAGCQSACEFHLLIHATCTPRPKGHCKVAHNHADRLFIIVSLLAWACLWDWATGPWLLAGPANGGPIHQNRPRVKLCCVPWHAATHEMQVVSDHLMWPGPTNTLASLRVQAGQQSSKLVLCTTTCRGVLRLLHCRHACVQCQQEFGGV